MEMNADAMYLMAVIQTLKNEIDDLKTEKTDALTKLLEAEKNVSMLKADNILLKMEKKDEKRHTQVAISKIRKERNRAYAHARRIENVSECRMSNIDNSANAKIKKVVNDAKDELQNEINQRNKEVQVWKEKYERTQNIALKYREDYLTMLRQVSRGNFDFCRCICQCQSHQKSCQLCHHYDAKNECAAVEMNEH